MNIILVPGHLAKSRTISLSALQLTGLAVALLLLPVMLGAFLYGLAASHGAGVSGAFSAVTSQQSAKKNSDYVHVNLNAMAIRLGKMQSQLLRLDALGERLAKSAGVKREEFRFDQPPGRGGAEPSVAAHDLSLNDFGKQLEILAVQLDDRADRLGILEAMVLQDGLKRRALPSFAPLAGNWHSSNFGWRIDPFTGRETFHEGIDFPAQIGTPILAAAAGVVVNSEYHPQYGNMVEIDHGNGLISRYAHASARLVKIGDVVLAGQKIALVGSTGRSTGSHLHFEVRQKGVAQNPAKFLQAAR